MKTLPLHFKILAVLGTLIVAAGIYVVATGTTVSLRSASAAAPVLYDEQTLTSLYDSASPAVVQINVTQPGTGIYGRSLQEGQGSGFLVDPAGYILTNNHVVDGATSVQVLFKDGQTVDATVIGKDAVDDVALIKVDPSAISGLAPLQLGDSSTVKPGQMAVAIGSPYGLINSITVGIISGVNRSLEGSGLTGLLQTDASINPGNSGGPLLDSNGKVIGINTAVESVASGIGFAVPSNTASKVLPDLKAGKQVIRPWLGISGVQLTQTLAQKLNISVTQGVYVVTVTAGSPAEKAGLKGSGIDSSGAPAAGGDVITAVDGKAVATVNDLSTYFNTKKGGDNVVLKVWRSGTSTDITVTLGAWPAQTPTDTTPKQIPQPSIPLPWNGHPRQQVPAQ